MVFMIEADEPDQMQDENFIGQQLDPSFLKQLAERHEPKQVLQDPNESWTSRALATTGQAAKGFGKRAISGTLGLPGNIGHLLGGKGAPTTQQLEEMFGWDEPQGAEEFGARAGDIFGPTALMAALTGGISTVPQVLALLAQSGIGAAAGQGAKALGFGPVGQALAELLGGFGAGKITKSAQVASKVPKVQKELEHFERLGVSPESRNVLKQAGEKNYRAARGAAKSPEAQHAVETASREISEAAKRVQKNAIPGYKMGREAMKTTNDAMWQNLQKAGDAIPIVDNNRLLRTADDLLYQAKKVPASVPERQTYINFLQDFKKSIMSGKNLNGQPLTVGDLMTFYKDNNSMLKGKEGSFIRGGGMKALQRSLVRTAADQGANGKVVAESWLNMNKVHQKYKKTGKALDYLEGLVDNDGKIKFGTLTEYLHNADKRHLFTEVLGQGAVHDLGRLAKYSQNVKGLQNAMNSAELRGMLEKGALTGIAGTIFSTATKLTEPWTIAASAIPYGLLKGEQVLQKKILTDPRYQNMTANFLESAGKGAMKQATGWAKKIEEALREDENKEAPAVKAEAASPKGRYFIEPD